MSTAQTQFSGVTHQDFELAEGGGGAVEETGRQPSLVLVAVADGRAWGGREWRERRGGECVHEAAAEKRLEASFICCQNNMGI